MEQVQKKFQGIKVICLVNSRSEPGHIMFPPLFFNTVYVDQNYLEDRNR